MLIGFKAQFADAVERGEKRQTIRALRKGKRFPDIGERLYLYTGLRRPGCRKLGEGVCESRERILIADYFPTVTWNPDTYLYCTSPDVESIARADGFETWSDLRAWFEDTHGLPFAGTLIRWRLVPRAEWAKP